MMKKSINKNKNSRGGAASLYVVIFITLLFGVITLSFVRLVISEATQTTNADLSKSAYDSALAGVEDAKTALLKYHDCLSQGYSGVKDSTVSCQKIIYEMQTGIASDSCDTVAKSLGRQQNKDDGAVIIQETTDTTIRNTASELVQAYTCVKISEELPDYRTTLNYDTRIRIIPLRSEHINDLGTVLIRWFSSQNKGNSKFNWGGIRRTDQSTPPIISVQFLQADQPDDAVAGFKLSELSSSSRVNKVAGSTNRGTIFLQPGLSTNLWHDSLSDNVISGKQLSESSDKSPLREKATDTIKPEKYIYQVKCKDIDTTADWYCDANIGIPRTYRNNANRNPGATFLIVALPYGTPATDISVELHDNTANQTIIPFTGVQARVDSTGRANDLYRRVETRVELVDVNYPYPEFTIQMNDGSESVIKKNFSVTTNCWSADNGNYYPCTNNLDLSKY